MVWVESMDGSCAGPEFPGGVRRSDGLEMQPTEQPKNQKHDHNQAQNPAQTGGPVALVSVVTTPAAEEKNEYNDNEDQTHDAPEGLSPIGSSRAVT